MILFEISFRNCIGFFLFLFALYLSHQNKKTNPSGLFKSNFDLNLCDFSIIKNSKVYIDEQDTFWTHPPEI